MNLIRKRHPHEFKKNMYVEMLLKHLANEYHIEEESAKRRLKLAQSLLDQLLKHSDLKLQIMINTYSLKVRICIT